MKPRRSVSRRRPLAGGGTVAAALALGGLAIDAGPPATIAPPAAAATEPVVAIPAPGSVTASPETTVSFRSEAPVPVGDLPGLVVTGSDSGMLDGSIEFHPDSRGLTFAPENSFTPGETVTVDVPFAVFGAEGGGYSFTVGTPPADGAAPAEEAPAAPEDAPPMVAASRTRPDLRPPRVSVDPLATRDVDDGLLFATPQPSALTDAGVLIYDDDGEVVYFEPNRDPEIVVGDAAVRVLDGEPVLTWFEGVAPYGPGNYRGEYVIVDSTYREVARFDMGNGYHADIHDLILTPEGTALMMAYNPLVCDEAVLTGCTPGGIVLDGVLQEIDLATGTVLFEWHGLDHLLMADSFANPESNPFDYLHPNSIDIDDDGNVLLSARLTSALYKIDRTTGEMIFTFGGRSNEFTYVDEGSDSAPGPDFPHDFRTRGDGVYSYFDNGVRRDTESRGAIVELDADTMTATYLESITHDPPLLGPTQGRTQGLANGNELIAWGGLGVVTEYTAEGTVAFEASLGVGSYRQVRHEWVGEPADPPDATLTTAEGTAVTVAVSWNGDTRTESWQLLAGESADALEVVDTVERSGFETEIATTTGPRYVAVQALDGDGQPIDGGRSEALPADGS